MSFVESTKGLVDSYAEHLPGRLVDHRAGMVVLLHNDGTRLDIVPTLASSYILPDLLLLNRDIPLARRYGKDWLGAHFTRRDQNIIFNKVGTEADALRWTDWVESGNRYLNPILSQYIDEPAEWPTAYDKNLLRQGSAIKDVTRVRPLAADASTAAIASHISRLSELDDARLGKLFKVERETFWRWRTGALTNPRVGNRRRLGLLLRLLEDVVRHGMQTRDWLLNYATATGQTPYEMLEQGRLDEVAYLAAAIGSDAAYDDKHLRSVSEAVDHGQLVFDDDDQWELEVADDDG
ncbi:MAG TPA: hypothetical protein VIC06_03895 [Solirubrobacteraceae bacterium]|jgi:hypothetical protein